jgi:hypothetical protein
MADRYWVGGTGTWDGASTTNWAASSGGASGASVPTAADNVFFDANSNVGTGTFTVTMATTPRLCNDFTASGLDGTMTLAGSAIGLTVSGSLTFQATNFTRSYTGTTTFNATTTGKTVTTNGVAFGGPVTFNGAGGAWTLGSAISSGTNTITVTNGTFSTSASNYSITASIFLISADTNTKSISFNGSTITLSSGATAFDGTGGSGTTFNAGTSTIILSGSSLSFVGAGRTYYNVSLTSTVSANGNFKTISGTNTFNNLSISTPTVTACNPTSFSASQTITGTLTATGSNGSRRLYICSGVSSGPTFGTSITLTCAAIAAMSDVDFSDITIAGAAGTLSGTRLGDCGGNSNITFGAGTTKYWNLTAGGNWNDNAWATVSGGAVTDTFYPLPQDTAVIDNTGLTITNTITLIANVVNVSGLNASTRTDAMTFATGTTTPVFFGNFAYGSGVSTTGTGTFTFSNRSIKTLNSGGVAFTQPITIDAPSGGIQLLTNNIAFGAATRTNLKNGTLDLNGLIFGSGLFSTATGTKNITFNGGTFQITGTSATAWNNAVPTGFTTTAGTGTGTISMTSASAKTFVGGGSTYNCTLNQGGAGTLTITGSNTFSNITNTTQPAQITFTASTTNTFTNFSLSGTAGNLITLRSSSSGTRFTLSKSTGTVSVSYLDIQDSAATGGASWRALLTNGNVNSGNNTGWLFVLSSFLIMFM